MNQWCLLRMLFPTASLAVELPDQHAEEGGADDSDEDGDSHHAFVALPVAGIHPG